MTQQQKEMFQDAIKQRCLESDSSCVGLWSLAVGVFVTQLMGQENLGFFFFYDGTVLRLQDRRSHVDIVTAPLFEGLEWAFYAGHKRNRAQIFRFGGDPDLIANPESALNYAKKVLCRIDGGEISWLKSPHEIQMPF